VDSKSNSKSARRKQALRFGATPNQDVRAATVNLGAGILDLRKAALDEPNENRARRWLSLAASIQDAIKALEIDLRAHASRFVVLP